MSPPPSCTLLVSDLHLGSVSGADLLRRREMRVALLDALADVDRLVLLGDVLELRHGPMREALRHARPFFEDLGAALGGRELVITFGNHDHALVDPWLASRAAGEGPAALELENELEPERVSPALARLVAWAAPARVRVVYPGLWVREDVYAMHGHYLDAHLTVPTLERLSVAAMARLLKRSPQRFHTVEDYESVGGPVYAWRDAVARDGRTGDALNGFAMVSAWQALSGLGEDRLGLLRRVRRRALAAGFPLAVAALNRAGFGPLKADISGAELRRAGLGAMGEVAARLGLGERYVIFGHTHRTGPLPGDDEREWRGRGGARLVNTGSWTYAPVFLGTDSPHSPYWPGGAVLVQESGPPRVLRLLEDRTHEQLAEGSTLRPLPG